MKEGFSNPRIVHCTGAAVLLCLTAALYSLVAVPIWHNQRERAGLQTELVDRLRELDRQDRTRRGLSVQLSHVIEETEAASFPLKSPSGLNEELASVSELAENAGLQLNSVEPGTAVANGKLRVLPIQVSGKATYRDIHRFLDRLRQERLDTCVRRFDVAADASVTPAIATVHLELLWLTALEPGGPPNGSIP